MLSGDQQPVFTAGFHQRQQLLPGQGQAGCGARGGWDRQALECRIDLPYQPGGSHGSATHHDAVGACLGQAALGILGSIDVSVRDHRNGEGLLNGGDGSPVRLAFEPLLAGPAVQGEQLRTGVLQLPAPGLRVGVTAAPAESCLHRDGQPHGIGHGFDDPAGEFGVADQP